MNHRNIDKLDYEIAEMKKTLENVQSLRNALKLQVKTTIKDSILLGQKLENL